MPMRMFWKRKYHGRMHVITRKRLNEFAEKFPETNRLWLTGTWR